MVQYEIKITGRVKGVGFRYFVQKRASEHGIKGWVKNVPSGLLVMAQGHETDMDTFVDYLKTGPQLAMVKNITRNKMPNLESFDGFMVKY